MKKRRRSAYEIPYAKVELPQEDKRRAIEWWQRGEDYHPIACPVCGNVLTLAAQGVALECPTDWCSYLTEEIPWAVYVAFVQSQL